MFIVLDWIHTYFCRSAAFCSVHSLIYLVLQWSSIAGPVLLSWEAPLTPIGWLFGEEWLPELPRLDWPLVQAGSVLASSVLAAPHTHAQSDEEAVLFFREYREYVLVPLP